MHKHIVHCALCVQYISACTIILCVHCASMSYIQWVQCTICLFVHWCFAQTHCRAIHVSRFQAVHMVAEDFTIRSRNGFGWIPSAKAQLRKQVQCTNIGTHNVHTHTHTCTHMHTDVQYNMYVRIYTLSLFVHWCFAQTHLHIHSVHKHIDYTPCTYTCTQMYTPCTHLVHSMHTPCTYMHTHVHIDVHTST